MIAWLYLNKKTAAIDALKDYSAMRYIIDNYHDTLADMEAKMVSVPSTMPTGMPKNKSNPKAGEARLVHAIAEIDVLQERYRQALEFMDWFQPAWDALSADEQYVLSEFYLSDDKQIDSVMNICDYFTIEKSSAYKKKDRALERMALLLYGK